MKRKIRVKWLRILVVVIGVGLAYVSDTTEIRALAFVSGFVIALGVQRPAFEVEP